MADNELQYNVRFKTTAEGTGAKQTLAEIKAVADVHKQMVPGMAEEQYQAKGLAAANYNLSYSYRENKAAADDANSSHTRTTNTVVDLADGVEKVGKKSKVGADGLLQVAYAADDAQYGIRGILNNIPGLVIGLGGTAGLAGGISIAVLALSQLISMFSKAEDGAAALKETSQDVLTNAAQGVLNVLEKQKNAIEDAQKKAKVESAPDQAGEEALAKAAKAREEQLKTIATVTEQLNQILGRQTTALETIAETERASAAARKLAAESAIAAEEKKIETARAALETAKADRDAKEQALALAQLNASALDTEVKKLQQKRDLLQQTSEQRVGLAEALAQGAVLPGQKTAAAERAGADLGEANAQLDAAAVRANQFNSAATKLTTTLSRYDEVIAGAAQALERQKAASEQNIDTILQQQGVQAAADKATEIQSATSAIAGQLTSAVDLAKTQVGVAGETATEIKNLLEGGLTSDELKKIPALVSTLIATYKGDVQQLQTLLNGVIEAATSTNATTSQLVRDVAELKRQAANRGTGSP